MHQHYLFHSKWLLCIKNILYESDKEQVWSNQEAPLNMSKTVKLKLIERYKSSWKELVFQSPKCLKFLSILLDLKYFGVLPDDLVLAFFSF